MNKEESIAYLEHFVKAYSSAYSVNLAEDSFEVFHMDHDFKEVFKMDGTRSDMERFIEEHIHPDDREKVSLMTDRNYLRERLKTESEITFTMREQYKGQEKTMHVIIMRGADNDHAAVGFMDVTEELREEKELNERLEAASRAKTEFLFNMSHDIRTPINAILGFARMAKKHSDEPEQIEDCLDKIETSGVQLLDLINSVLEMSRIESGNIEVDEKPMDMMNCMDNIAPLMETLALTKSISFTSDVHDVKDRFIWGDRGHMNRIMTNIISNAIKYTHDGGKVHVDVSQTSSDGETGLYRFAVSDTGIGMSEEFQKRLFDEFARENNTTESKQQGTGLGLSIAKHLIDALGGEISVESEQGKGTSFFIDVPMRIQSEADIRENYRTMPIQGEITGRTYNLAGKKVLLVEDNDLNREIAADILEEEEMVVDWAEDGQIALNMVKDKGIPYYDIILMDIQMPVMDGYQATREIRKLDGAENQIIIALSANAFDEDKRRSIEAGMNAHIAKPVDVDELKGALEEYING